MTKAGLLRIISDCPQINWTGTFTTFAKYLHLCHIMLANYRSHMHHMCSKGRIIKVMHAGGGIPETSLEFCPLHLSCVLAHAGCWSYNRESKRPSTQALAGHLQNQTQRPIIPHSGTHFMGRNEYLCLMQEQGSLQRMVLWGWFLQCTYSSNAEGPPPGRRNHRSKCFPCYHPSVYYFHTSSHNYHLLGIFSFNQLTFFLKFTLNKTFTSQL